MGFGFNLFGFPILVIATTLLLVAATRNRSALKILGIIWSGALVLLVAGSIADNLRKPIVLTKEKIVGEYRIDTSFYPGKNAQWQHDHFKFIITRDDSIHFIVLNDQQKPSKIYNHKIDYHFGPPDRWSINADNAYHVIKSPPTLYRGHKKFYYVFESPKYGNMFFRKIASNVPTKPSACASQPSTPIAWLRLPARS